MSTSGPRILIFDSGAGGLTIARQVLCTRKHCHIHYAADNAYFPYGLKDDKALTERIVSQVELLHDQLKPDLVIMACNTASTLALDILRQEFKCAFVGVVPAIKPAAKMSKTDVIGVFATPATINRSYTHQLISDFASDKQVILYGSDVLVHIAEQFLLTGKYDKAKLLQVLEEFFSQPNASKVDTAVLACTHFPLLKEALLHETKSLGHSIQFVDSADAIARRTLRLLEDHPAGSESKIDFYFSDNFTDVKTEISYRNYLASCL